MKHFKNIAAFSFWEFCQEAQQAIKDGYEFSDLNDCMPVAYVGSYSCVMVKDTQDDVQNAPEQPQIDPEAKVNTELPTEYKNAIEAVSEAPKKSRGKAATK